eukprot:sb/3471184/
MGRSILSGKNAKCSESLSQQPTTNLSNSDSVHSQSHFKLREREQRWNNASNLHPSEETQPGSSNFTREEASFLERHIRDFGLLLLLLLPSIGVYCPIPLAELRTPGRISAQYICLVCVCISLPRHTHDCNPSRAERSSVPGVMMSLSMAFTVPPVQISLQRSRALSHALSHILLSFSGLSREPLPIIA